MERKTTFCSCRLAAHHETGRVRWCVGQEIEWQTKLKRLVFLPVVLLPLVVIIIFLSRYTLASDDVPEVLAVDKFEELEQLNHQHQILNRERTVYAPQYTDYLNFSIDKLNNGDKRRRKRHHFKKYYSNLKRNARRRRQVFFPLPEDVLYESSDLEEHELGNFFTIKKKRELFLKGYEGLVRNTVENNTTKVDTNEEHENKRLLKYHKDHIQRISKKSNYKISQPIYINKYFKDDFYAHQNTVENNTTKVDANEQHENERLLKYKDLIQRISKKRNYKISQPIYINKYFKDDFYAHQNTTDDPVLHITEREFERLPSKEDDLIQDVLGNPNISTHYYTPIHHTKKYHADLEIYTTGATIKPKKRLTSGEIYSDDKLGLDNHLEMTANKIRIRKQTEKDESENKTIPFLVSMIEKKDKAVLEPIEDDITEKLPAFEINTSLPFLNESDRPFFWNNDKNQQEIRKLQSKTMQKYMNKTMDPCENFYEYACGRWKDYYDIPSDRATYDTFEIVRESMEAVLKDLLLGVNSQSYNTSKKEYEEHFAQNILQNSLQISDTSDATVKAKNYYISCMNEELIMKRGVKPLINLLDTMNGWPILGKWNSSGYDVVNVIGQLRLLNNDILISQWVGPDMKNSNDYIIHIDQTNLGLPTRDYYLEKSYAKHIEAYRTYIINVAMLMGADNKTATDDADDIVEFEIRIAEVMATTTERRNLHDIYLKTDVGSMSLYFPQFDWKRYFDMILEKDVQPQIPVACYCGKYLGRLFALITKTPPRVIQNFLIWRFVKHRVNNLDKRFSEVQQAFLFVLFGRETQPPRWQFCISQANLNIGMAVGSLFVKNYFDKSSKYDTIKMTNQLSEAFKQLITENVWLDNSTKEYARMKIDEMDLKIGFPDFVLNDTELAERYRDVEIHPDYYLENSVGMLKHVSREDQQRLGTFINRTIWSTPPAVVNAYYSRNKNQIMFPAGMLQPPFYHRYFPKALNFGGIGVVIGHEITHGFDDKGRLFDQHGNLHFWWRDESVEKFNEKSKCMIDQYNQYIVPEVDAPLDGLLTQGENIADNGGLKQGYRAYENWLAEHPDADETLPDIPLNGRQLFFLNFAQVWCGQQKLEAAKHRMKTSVHAPGVFRVIGVLSNSVEFSEVFKCPKNSPMNPEFKCIIW